MNTEINMSVAPMQKKGGEKGVYILFSDGDRTCEFCLPGARLLKSKGFSREELDALTEYVKDQQSSIISLAKTIDPMRSFMGK